MKKIEVLSVLLVLVSVVIVYSQQSGTSIGIKIGEIDSDNDGIPDSIDTDDDNDGILDTDDPLTGNSSSVQSNTVTVNVSIDYQFDLKQIFAGLLVAQILDKNVPIVNFTFDFDQFLLNLANITIQRQTIEGKGSLLVRGIVLSSGRTKTMYVDNINTSTDKLCIKDAQIDKISEISSDCTGTNETLITCPGTTGSYTCTKVEDSARYKITGLDFTGIIETSATEEVEPGGTTTTTTTTGGDGDGAAGGGGGGGGPVVAKRDFNINKETLKVILKQGQTKEESITIKNTGDVTLEIITNLEALSVFIFSPDSNEINVILTPNEERTLNFVFGAEEDIIPNIYTGELTVKSGSIEKIVNIIMEIESAKPLFDVDVEVLPEYKSVLAGESIFLEVSLFNVRGFGRVDVKLEYTIRDFQGNILATEQETVAVETQAKFGRELLVPSDIKPGTYVASVKVIFEDSVGLSSDVFEVKAKEIRLIPIILKDYTAFLLVGIIVLIIISIFSVYRFYPPKKTRIPKTQEEAHKIIKSEEKIKHLEKELGALQQAFNAKFISENSYNKGKERIEKQLNKLKRQT